MRLVVTLIAALAAACGSQIATPTPAAVVTPATSPTPVSGNATDAPEDLVFRTRLTMQDGRYGLDIVLRDATDLVASIGAAPPGNRSFDEGVENPDGQPDALLYTWIGGACDTVTTITFERAGIRFRLRATTETTGQACELIGLARQLLIRLNEPIDASLVNLAED
jgi:hypothetical protein